SENRRLNNLNKEYSSLQKNQRSLERKNDEWTRSLKAARAAEPKNPRRKYDPSGKAASMVLELKRRRLKGEVISAEDIKRAVVRLRRELRVNPMSKDLDGDQVEINWIIDYARLKVSQEIIRLFNERQFNFPDQ